MYRKYKQIRRDRLIIQYVRKHFERRGEIHTGYCFLPFIKCYLPLAMKSIIHGYPINLAKNRWLALHIEDRKPLPKEMEKFYYYSDLVFEKMFYISVWGKNGREGYRLELEEPWARKLQEVLNSDQVYQLLSDEKGVYSNSLC